MVNKLDMLDLEETKKWRRIPAPIFVAKTEVRTESFCTLEPIGESGWSLRKTRKIKKEGRKRWK